MKKLLTISLLLFASIANAQQSFFRGHNNYVVPVIPFQAPPIITTGLILNLDAGNPASYPGNGTTWYDLSTNSNNGTIANSTMANTATTPKSFTFNGTSGNNVSFNPSKFNVPYTGKTVMIAAKMDANFGTNLFRGLFGSSSPQRNFNFYIYNNGSGYKLHFSSWNSSGNIGGGWLSDVVQLVTGQWYVFAFTQDATSVRFFVNGQLVGTSTGTTIMQYQATPDERLGATDNYWLGDIGTILIYKRGLSGDEILENYDALKTVFGLPSILTSNVQVPTVLSTTGKTWMDRNLGETQIATSSTDAASYGDLYQWGRGTDGHEKRAASTTSTLSSGDVPGNAKFIIINDVDWRSAKNDNLWQGVNGTNNPCPAGFRLPTETEWIAEQARWSPQNQSGAFSSPLKLPMAGYRIFHNGAFDAVGAGGYYWSNTVSGLEARFMRFNSSLVIATGYRSYGFSVRCIKD